MTTLSHTRASRLPPSPGPREAPAPADSSQAAIAARIAALTAGWSCRALAAALGVSRETVRRYRSGRCAIPGQTLATGVSPSGHNGDEHGTEHGRMAVVSMAGMSIVRSAAARMTELGLDPDGP